MVVKLLLLGVAVGKASSLAFDSDAFEQLCRFFLLFLLSLLDMIRNQLFKQSVVIFYKKRLLLVG